MIQYDLIDNNLNQIFSDPYSINKSMLRIVLLSQLTNKDFDIENLFLFYQNEIFYKQNAKNILPSQLMKPFKRILVKLRDNLQKTIDLLPE